MNEPLYEWNGTEYAFEEHGADWYWALGIIAIALCVAALLFGDLILALLIIAGAAAIALQAAKHRRIHHFSIHHDGLAIDGNLYLFTDMRDFGILEYIDPSLPPALSIKTNHIFAPHLLVPIHNYDPDEIYAYISQHLPEGVHEETLLDRVTTLLRF